MTLPDHRAAKRLVTARQAAGYETPADAARALGVSAPTYWGHENGSRGLSRAAGRYADFFKVSADWLVRGRGRGPTLVPVVGYVGAGAEVFAFDDYPQGGGLERVEGPPGEDGCIAVVIRGDSQHPLQEGWLIFYRRENGGIEEGTLGKLCVVKVTDGTTMLKTLRRGSRKGLWTLESWNAPPKEDVQLEWATRVLDIRPR